MAITSLLDNGMGRDCPSGQGPRPHCSEAGVLSPSEPLYCLLFLNSRAMSSDQGLDLTAVDFYFVIITFNLSKIYIQYNKVKSQGWSIEFLYLCKHLSRDSALGSGFFHPLSP